MGTDPVSILGEEHTKETLQEHRAISATPVDGYMYRSIDMEDRTAYSCVPAPMYCIQCATWESYQRGSHISVHLSGIQIDPGPTGSERNRQLVLNRLSRRSLNRSANALGNAAPQ